MHIFKLGSNQWHNVLDRQATGSRPVAPRERVRGEREREREERGGLEADSKNVFCRPMFPRDRRVGNKEIPHTVKWQSTECVQKIELVSSREED